MRTLPPEDSLAPADLTAAVDGVNPVAMEDGHV